MSFGHLLHTMLPIILMLPLLPEQYRVDVGLSSIVFLVFSKRQRITLRLLYAIAIPSVVCMSVCLSSVCLSVVCDVGAPYSGG